MSAIELRQEMLELIKNEDDSSLKNLYQLILAYKQQRTLDKMIAEGEEDIEAGRVHSMDEVKEYIKNWKAS
ncbi:MAG: hypothetical protein COB81_02845 [Flavobacteriaceae bacterium]|nr:MAG: hypothetical protein COB81_02845 [Flavobacteriaceae bacterium]